MQQSPTHFSFHPTLFIISVAAAIVINSAAAALFLFHPFIIKTNFNQNSVFTVYIEQPKQSKHLKTDTTIFSKPSPKSITNKTNKPKTALKKQKQIKHNLKKKNASGTIQKPAKIIRKKKSQIGMPKHRLSSQPINATGSPQKTKILKTQHNKQSTSAQMPIQITSSSYPDLFSWIASHKFYPIEALYNNQQGVVKIRFRLTENGAITEIKIIKGSFESLNRAAIRILKDSSPVPAGIMKHLPFKLPADLTVRLIFKLE